MTTTALKTHEIDATGIAFGRLASKVASLLIGKSKASYLPHLDNGDAVVVSNVEKVKITGNKLSQKIYRRHTGYPGNMKELPMKQVLAEDPERILVNAVMGMLPKNKHRAIYIKRLSFKK